MDTIISYVENIFTSLPNTMEITKIKEDIKTNMLDKYEELLTDGRSENEAIGQVISEFGNIEELLDELGIDYSKEVMNNEISLETVQSYIKATAKKSMLTTLGVCLCILSIAISCFFDGLLEMGLLSQFVDSEGESLFSMTSSLLLVTIAIGIFIYSSSSFEKFKFIDHGVTINSITKEYITKQLINFQPVYTKYLITGIILCILSPSSIYVFESIYGEDSSMPGFPFFLIIAIAVSLFVYNGCKKSAYKKLLKQQSDVQKAKKQSRLYTVTNITIVLVATAVYFVEGICFKNWTSGLIIYGITAICCGIASTILWGITKTE